MSAGSTLFRISLPVHAVKELKSLSPQFLRQELGIDQISIKESIVRGSESRIIQRESLRSQSVGSMSSSSTSIDTAAPFYTAIGRIEKAKIYAEEHDRIEFEKFVVYIKGENRNKRHRVEYYEGQWHCDCEFFASRGVCSHSMAMERILKDMVEIGKGYQ